MNSGPLTVEEKEALLATFRSMDFFAKITFLLKNHKGLKDRGLTLSYPTLQDAEGSLYKYKSKNGSMTSAYFYCDSLGCGARATVDLQANRVKYAGDHIDHGKVEETKVEFIDVREDCRRMAIKDQFVHPLEIQQQIQEKFRGRQLEMPTFQEIQRIVYDVRGSNKLDDETLLTRFLNTREEDFFWFSYKDTSNFAYVYSTPFQQRRAQESQHCQYFLDNYYKVPAPFTQVLNLLVYDEKLSSYIPVVHILLSTKKQEFYETILMVLQDKLSLRDKERKLVKPFKPHLLTVDYERGLYQAAQYAFNLAPNQIVGCLFHYSQAVWRRIHELGLRKKEQMNTTCQVANALILLAFVDLHQIHECFMKITETFQEQDYEDLFIYYRKTWLEDINSALWNQSSRLREDASFKTTNNAIESFHNQILLNCSKVILTFAKDLDFSFISVKKTTHEDILERALKYRGGKICSLHQVAVWETCIKRG